MKQAPITVDLKVFPAVFHSTLQNAPVYDSSCSPQARVWYIEKDGGMYLKTSARGSLSREAEMTAWFHGKGLSAQVLAYESCDADWLLTRAVPGEDCTGSKYLDDPKRLSELLGILLRRLHETPTDGCPILRTQEYIAAAEENYRAGRYDASLFPDNWGYRCPEDAWANVQLAAPQLKADTLIHGDYCLPNLLLEDWRFSGFIDLGNAGIGDRHMDLFWGAWSLRFNLKTDAWCKRFLDAYGRDHIDPELLRSIAAFEVFL